MDDNQTDSESMTDTDSTSAQPTLDTQLNLEKSINLVISQIERLKEETKPIKEMMDSYLENDENYRKVEDLAKEAAKKKSEVKRALLDTQNGRELKMKLDEKREEMKAAKESLTGYLTEYKTLTGSDNFEADDGELRQIVFAARLVRKTNFNLDT